MDDADAELLELVARAIRQFTRDIITARELTDKLTDYLAAQTRVPTHLAPRVVALLPEPARLVVHDWTAKVLAPEYRKGAWAGIGYATPEDEAAQSAMLTARVKAMAEALREALTRLER